MIGRVSVEVPTTTYTALLQQLRQSGSAADPAQALTAAVELWVAEQRRLAGVAPAEARGYQWKCLFLPEGTELRCWSYAQHKFARVEGDQIIFDGRAVTPNQFARTLAGIPRNAWHDLSIRMPGEGSFTLAAVLRRRALAGNSGPDAPAAPTLDGSALPLSQAAVQQLAIALATALAKLAPSRSTEAGPRWDLPERRQFRYRAEDLAAD